MMLPGPYPLNINAYLSDSGNLFLRFIRPSAKHIGEEGHTFRNTDTFLKTIGPLHIFVGKAPILFWFLNLDNRLWVEIHSRNSMKIFERWRGAAIHDSTQHSFEADRGNPAGQPHFGFISSWLIRVDEFLTLQRTHRHRGELKIPVVLLRHGESQENEEVRGGEKND